MSTPLRILLALVFGIGLGAGLAHYDPQAAARVVIVADPVGQTWLNGLRMTIIPLVVSLLVTGIASTASAAKAGGVAGRSLAAILAMLWFSSLAGWVLSDLFWQIAPMPAAAGSALKAALSQHSGALPPTPSIVDFLKSIVPSNPIAAAANDQTLPLIVFAGVFGFAVTRLPTGERERLVAVFKSIADTMLIVIRWVLWLAPLGVFALGLTVGARAGIGAAGALAHYVATLSTIGFIVMLVGYPLAAIGGRVALGRFARAVLPCQAVAISTRSSIAALPVMLGASESLGVAPAIASVVLPLEIALMRSTGPAMNLGVALYVAHWLGIHLSPAQIVAGIALGATTTLGAVSLPGEVSFVSSIGPIALALGVPLEPLLLLVAVEPLPDIFRTLGNVVNDVAVTTVVARLSGNVARSPAVLSSGGTA